MRLIVRHDLSRLSARLGRLAGTLSSSLEEPLRAIGGIVATVTLGLVLLLVLIASSEAVHNNPTPEARQDAQIRIVVLGLMLFFAVLIFIGIVFLVT